MLIRGVLARKEGHTANFTESFCHAPEPYCPLSGSLPGLLAYQRIALRSLYISLRGYYTSPSFQASGKEFSVVQAPEDAEQLLVHKTCYCTVPAREDHPSQAVESPANLQAISHLPAHRQGFFEQFIGGCLIALLEGHQTQEAEREGKTPLEMDLFRDDQTLLSQRMCYRLLPFRKGQKS